jgi:hypothetical protein
MTIENKNELAENTQINENAVSVVEREDENFVIVKEDGKFIRKAKFHDYSSIKAETKEDKIWMLNLLEGDEESGNGLKDHVGEQSEVADVITRKYDRINEETGQQEYGVLTYLITPERQVFVTSSKTVYFSITRIMDLFGKPDSDEWENITVRVGKQKGQNGDIIKIKMVG